MLEFAKDKAFWEKVRTADEYKWHIEEIKAVYNEAFKTEPRAHSAEDILNNDDKGLWRLQFDHLQSSCLLSLIYPDNEEYYNNLIKSVWAYLNDYSWAPLGHFTEYYYQRTPKDFDCGLIDIFAASAGFALAEMDRSSMAPSRVYTTWRSRKTTLQNQAMTNSIRTIREIIPTRRRRRWVR